MPLPLLVAHRGSSADEPENTLRAFRKALSLRVDAIELDVHTTCDGVPVVFHDDDTRRLTGVKGRMAELSWREVRKLCVRGRERIPRLQEVLRVVGRRARVQIELKRGADVLRVIAAVRAARATQRVILASFELSLLIEARKRASTVPRMVISDGRTSASNLRRQLRQCGAIGLSVDHRAVSDRRWVTGFQSRGFGVWTWTVNRPPAMHRMIRRGVDAILSDNPALLRSAIRLFSLRFPYVRGRTNRDDNPARSPLR